MLLVAMATLAVTACQNRNNDLFGNIEESSKMKDFTGTFAKKDDCSAVSPKQTVKGVINKVTGSNDPVDRATQEVISRHAANLTFATNHFTDADCKGPVAYSVEVYAEGDIKKDENQSDKSHDIQLRYKHVMIVPQSEDGVKILNDSKVCNITDYKVGVPAKVNDDCVSASRKAGTEELTTVRVDKNVLYIGKSAVGLSVMTAGTQYIQQN